MKSKRRRKGRVADVEAEVDRRMLQILAVIRREFGNSLPTFSQAVRQLREQAIAQGGDGTLRDCQVFLNEDGRSAMLYAGWQSDQTLCANFALPAPTIEAEFNAQHYVDQAEG